MLCSMQVPQCLLLNAVYENYVCNSRGKEGQFAISDSCLSLFIQEMFSRPLSAPGQFSLSLLTFPVVHGPEQPLSGVGVGRSQAESSSALADRAGSSGLRGTIEGGGFSSALSHTI